mgnify:CR=1 FL=1
MLRLRRLDLNHCDDLSEMDLTHIARGGSKLRVLNLWSCFSLDKLVVDKPLLANKLAVVTRVKR